VRRVFPLIILPLLFLAVAFATAAALSFLGDRAFAEWRLVFLGWERPVRWGSLVVGTSIAVACIAMLFTYEQRLVSRKLGWTLLSLRLLLILTLFLTLLEPVWSWSYNQQNLGRVIVALDLSESMETRDQAATPAEKLRWAKALGVIGGGETAERINQWIAAYEAGQEPEWVTPDEAADPVRRAQLEAARRQNLAGALQQIEQLSRKEILQRLILAKPEPLDQRLGKLVNLEFTTFAGEVLPTTGADLAKLFETPDPALLRGRTDLTRPVSAAGLSSQETPLVGVILFSDGRDNVHPTPQQFTTRFAGSAVPVHTVLIGSERRPKDLAIVTLEHPEKVFQDDEPVVRATIRTSGYVGEKLQIQLDEPGQENGVALTEEVVPTGEITEVSFKLQALSEGRHRFRVFTPVLSGETREDNNERDFALEVVDDKAHVLLLEGSGRWEFRYLHAALERDERVELQTVVFDQPYLGVLPETFFPRQIRPNPDPGAQPFAGFDVVIVGDVQMNQLPQEVWEQLDRYVRDDGGTLVLTAGKNYFPRQNTLEIVRDLLPVENLREIHLTDPGQAAPPDRRGFHLELTPDGALQTMLQFELDPLENERIWGALPGHTWGLVGESRPAATVWATLPPQGGADLGLEGERRRALIAQHYVGTGQVVWLGIDSTWRWRFRAGDKYHHRFWGQLVRWAVEFKASAGNSFVRFGVSRPNYSTGEPILLKAQWDERFLRQNPGVRAQVSIVRRNTNDTPVTIPLTPSEARHFVHEGRFPLNQPGDYLATLVVPGVPFPEQLEVEFVVSDKLSPELQDVSANRPLLEQAAQLTGGTFLLPDQLDRLPDLFQSTSVEKTIKEEITLFDHWLILVLFCLFGTTEWVLRKINGLP
jgi:hypothetical protein